MAQQWGTSLVTYIYIYMVLYGQVDVYLFHHVLIEGCWKELVFPLIWFYDIYFTGQCSHKFLGLFCWGWGSKPQPPQWVQQILQKIHPMIQVCQGFPPMPCCNKKHAHPGADECIKISPSSVCPQVLSWKKNPGWSKIDYIVILFPRFSFLAQGLVVWNICF